MSRHRYECRVRFSDVDVYGHVNNVKYFEYYQEARFAFLAGFAKQGIVMEPSTGLVVARLDVDYKRPILFRSSPYLVESWVTRVGRSSFDLGAEIKDGYEVLSKAHTVLVAFDLDSQASRPLTESEAELLNSLAE